MRDVGHSNGNGANRIVWAVCAAALMLYLAFQSWIATRVVDISERLVRIETRLNIGGQQ